MLEDGKPYTAMPRTSRRATSMFEKSKDVLTQTIRPPPFPLERGRSLRTGKSSSAER